MLIAHGEVPELLLGEIPEFRTTYDEHVQDNDEVLSHVLFGDLSRFTIAAYERGQIGVIERLVRLMERLLRDGDDYTKNLVAVSFVENIGPDDVDRGFFELYGPLLRADLKAVWGVSLE
jgi:hypothetical protein